MKFTFVRSSLDKGAEKSQCGENEGLHCVFLFLVKRGGSRSIATWTFFFEAKEESSSSSCVVCFSARGLLHWGKRVVYITTSARNFDTQVPCPLKDVSCKYRVERDIPARVCWEWYIERCSTMARQVTLFSAALHPTT